MRRPSVILALLSLLVQGCIMVKIGGVKSTESVRNGTSQKLADVQAISVSSIDPQLEPYGALSLWVTGEFEKKVIVTERIVQYGDEWMAIGLFPGYDSLANGYGKKDGKGLSPAIIGVPFVTIIANGILVGIPTLCSMLEVFVPEPSKRHSAHISEGGLIGTYKYEGEKYERGSYSKDVEKTESFTGPTLLKGYKVVIDGVEYADQNGVITIRRTFSAGEQVRFKIISLPNSPKSSQGFFESIQNVEFSATCNRQ